MNNWPMIECQNKMMADKVSHTKPGLLQFLRMTQRKDIFIFAFLEHINHGCDFWKCKAYTCPLDIIDMIDMQPYCMFTDY